MFIHTDTQISNNRYNSPEKKGPKMCIYVLATECRTHKLSNNLYQTHVISFKPLVKLFVFNICFNFLWYSPARGNEYGMLPTSFNIYPFLSIHSLYKHAEQKLENIHYLKIKFVYNTAALTSLSTQ